MGIEVSVVIPYFNRQNTIARALNSVINQTYRDFEVILVNDGSTDNSESIVKEIIQKHNEIQIKNINQDNRGPSVARNTGIKNALGKYIAFLDSDDEWLPEKLEKQLKLIDEFDIDMLGCSLNIVNHEGRVKKKKLVSEHIRKIKFIEMLFKHYFITPTVVVKKDIIITEGLFPEGQNVAEDSYIFTKISRKCNVFVANEPLVNVYKNLYGQNGLSSNLEEMEMAELKNFYHFRKDNYLYNQKIGLFLYIIVNVFSILKYIRRKLIVSARKIIDVFKRGI